MKRFLIIILLLGSISLFLSCSGGRGGDAQTGYEVPEIYHTPTEIDVFLNQINTNPDFSSFTRIEVVGQSKEGREIKALIISNNPGAVEDEPRIRLTGGIHGSEMISIEILLNFIEYLTSEYHKGNTDIVNLVDSRCIVIIPVLNPDGLVHGTRLNSNRVDLNRNFNSLSQPESLALSNYSISKVFHTSITYHSGAVLINMPFDYDSKFLGGDFPDEYSLVTDFALAYARGGFSSNPDVFTKVYNSDYEDYVDLVEGTINGGDWYVVNGSLQDWSYLQTGCLDLTIEVARGNPSTVAGIDTVYGYNRDSLIAYIKKAGYGVHGRVTDSVSGLPVSGVDVGITGGDIITKTDSEGYYHRILLPGNYTLTFRHSDYNNLDESVTVPDSEDGLSKNAVIVHN